MNAYRMPGHVASNTWEEKEVEAFAIQLKHGTQNHVGWLVARAVVPGLCVLWAIASGESWWPHLVFPAVIVGVWVHHYLAVRKAKRLEREAARAWWAEMTARRRICTTGAEMGRPTSTCSVDSSVSSSSSPPSSSPPALARSAI